MEEARGTKLYERFAGMAKDYDVITGSIADDRMFFVLDNFDYGEHKFEVIKNYFTDSKDDEYFWYKVLMAIDLNLLSNNAEEIALILEKNSAKVLKDYLLDNEIIMNQMNKEEFFKQLGYINDSFLQRKYIKKKIKK